MGGRHQRFGAFELVLAEDVEAFDELEGLSVSENVVSSRARTVFLGPASGLIVFSPPLFGVGTDVEPSAVVEVFLKAGDFV